MTIDSDWLLRAWGRRPWQPLVVVAAARLLLVIILLASGSLKPTIGNNAETGYLPIAERLISTGVFNDATTREDSKYPPLYPMTIAAVRLLGVSAAAAPAAMVVLQNLSDLATALLTFWAARRYFGPVVGSAAGLLWLVFPPAVLISTWVTAETMFTTALAASLALILAPPRHWSRMRSSVGTGGLLSVATLFRSTPIALAPLLALILWRWWGWRPALAFVSAFALPILPWSVRNKVALDDVIPVAVGLGSVFLQGSNEQVFNGTNKLATYVPWVAAAAERGIVKPADERESAIDRWLLQLGWEQYRLRWETRPWSYPGFAAFKFVRLWCGTEAGTPRRHQLLFLLSAIFVFPGLAGVAIYARRLAATLAGTVCLAVVGYFIALHMAVLPQLRYMIPVYPLLMAGTAALTWRRLVSDEFDTGLN